MHTRSASQPINITPIKLGPKTQTHNGIPFITQDLPVAKLSLSAEVPNFKTEAGKDGVVPENQLHGAYQRLGTAPIVVWHRQNGNYEVITGRHRYDLAKRTHEETIPCHVVKESDGFTVDMARALDAESNIRDGQGTIKDFVIYFDSCTTNEVTAHSLGLLSRTASMHAWNIAKFASNETRHAWKTRKINSAQAAAIAYGAQNNEELQREGINYALKGESAEMIACWLGRLSQNHRKAEQMDMFCSSVDYSKMAMDEAKLLLDEKKSITQTLRAIEGPAAAPEVARKNGVRIKNCKKSKAQIDVLKKRLAEIEGLTKVNRAKHERWHTASFDGSNNSVGRPQN